jgi:hypothetical protein
MTKHAAAPPPRSAIPPPPPARRLAKRHDPEHQQQRDRVPDAVAVARRSARRHLRELAGEAGSILRLTAHGVVIRSDSRGAVCTMEEAAFRAEELDEEAVGIAMAASAGRARSGW